MKFDYLLSIHASNTLVGNLFSLLIGSKIRIGPPESLFYSYKIDKMYGQHKQDYYFNFVRKFAEIKSKEHLELVKSIKINKIKPNKYNIGLEAKEYIIITPGSSPFDAFKRWSEKKYIKLILMLLKKTKFNIVILGTKSDHPIMLPIYLDFKKEYRVKFVDNFTLSESFHLISNCYLLISACTSSLHIGSLYDINMVSIYGPTNPLFTGPISKKNRVVSMDYKCSPVYSKEYFNDYCACYRNSFNKGSSSMKCIDDISVQKVYNAVKNFIDKKDIIPKS